jgi:hypothetical protein
MNYIDFMRGVSKLTIIQNTRERRWLYETNRTRPRFAVLKGEDYRLFLEWQCEKWQREKGLCSIF